MSWPFTRKKPEIVLALTITQQQISLLGLNSYQEIVHAVTIPLPHHVIVNHEIQDLPALSQTIHEAHTKANIREKKVMMAIDTALTIYQYLKLDASLDNISHSGQILLNAQQTIPYALNEIALDYQILPPISLHKALWVCARELHIRQLTQAAKLAGLKPILIDVEAFAIIRAATHCLSSANIQDYQTLGIIDIHTHRCLFIATHHEQLLMTHEEDIALPSPSEMSSSQDLSAHIYYETMDHYIQKLMAIIQRSIQFFENKTQHNSLSMLALSGPISLLEELKQKIETTLNIRCHGINPLLHMSLNNKISDDIYQLNNSWLLAFGLVKRGIPHAQH